MATERDFHLGEQNDAFHEVEGVIDLDPSAGNLRAVMGRFGSLILDVAATLGAYHLTYDPLIRLNVHLAAEILAAAKILRKPREVVERNYNNVVRLIFNRGIFGHRGDDFLQRTGRIRWDCSKEEKPPLTLSTAITYLTTPPSPGLRGFETTNLHLSAPDVADVDSEDGVALARVGELSIELLQESADRARALSVVVKALSPVQRGKIGSEVTRAKIADFLSKAIKDHSPYLVEPLPFLDGEMKILLQVLNWFGTMDGSYEVLEEAAQALERIINYWLETKIRDRKELEPKRRPAEITDAEALSAAKTLVSITRRPMPDAITAAHQCLREIQETSGERVCSLTDRLGISLAKDPAIADVFRTIKLPSDFDDLPRDIWEIIGINRTHVDRTPPLEFEFQQGLITTIVLPPQIYLEKQLDDIACWIALRFPLSRQLIIVMETAGARQELFSVATDEYFEQRLLRGQEYSYKPDTRVMQGDVKRRIQQAFGGEKVIGTRNTLRQFSEKLRWGFSVAELVPLFNDFIGITRSRLLKRITMTYQPEVVKKGLALALGIENTVELEDRFKGSGDGNLQILFGDKYFRALLALQAAEDIINRTSKSSGYDDSRRLSELIGSVLGVCFEVLWEPDLDQQRLTDGKS